MVPVLYIYDAAPDALKAELSSVDSAKNVAVPEKKGELARVVAPAARPASDQPPQPRRLNDVIAAAWQGQFVAASHLLRNASGGLYDVVRRLRRARAETELECEVHDLAV